MCSGLSPCGRQLAAGRRRPATAPVRKSRVHCVKILAVEELTAMLARVRQDT